MNIEEINSEILKVNNYLKKCLWMDFEFAINIDFRKPYYLSSLLYWNLNNSKPFIELVAGKEMWKVIDKYQVEEGNYIFKINAEDFDTAPIIIASKGLKAEIINKDPF